MRVLLLLGLVGAILGITFLQMSYEENAPQISSNPMTTEEIAKYGN